MEEGRREGWENEEMKDGRKCDKEDGEEMKREVRKE